MSNLPLPNYTQVPNYIIDQWMGKLTHAEFKVIILILRYTAGYHRRQASISYNHFEEKCGVSKRWVRDCCLKFESLGWLKIEHGDEKNANRYEILMQSEEEIKKSLVGNSVPQGGELSTPGVGNSVPPIKKEKKEKKDNNNSESVVVSLLNDLDLPDTYKLLLSEELSQEKAELLVKRVKAWKGRDSDAIACRTILGRWDGWDDVENKDDIQEKNAQFLASLAKHDGTDLGPITITVGNTYIEFSGGMKVTTFEIKQKDFIPLVKEYIEKIDPAKLFSY